MPAAKVMLNLGALPPKQNATDMKKDGQNVSLDVLTENVGQKSDFISKQYPRTPSVSGGEAVDHKARRED